MSTFVDFNSFEFSGGNDSSTFVDITDWILILVMIAVECLDEMIFPNDQHFCIGGWFLHT